MDDLSNFRLPFLNMNVSNLSGYSLLLTFLVLVVMVALFMRKKIKSYMNSRQKLINMSEDYERKRECRNSLRYHYDWALDRGEKTSAKDIGKEILRIDEEIKEMYEDYQFLKEKGFYPLKNL